MKTQKKTTSQQPPWTEFVLLIVTISMLTGLTIFFLRWVGPFNSEKLVRFMSEFGSYAMFVYVLLMVLAVLSPIPDFLVSVAGGYLFGPYLGTLLALLGHVIGTSYDFWLARHLGRKYLAYKYPGFIRKIDSYVKNLGWQTVAIFRIIPSVSFDFVGYAAGISAISYMNFIGGSLLGVIPMAFLQNFLGTSLRPGHHLVRWITAGIFLGVVLITLLIQWKKQSHQKHH